MITSKQNKTFKLYKSLMLKKYRDLHDLFLVYGKHIIDVAKENHAIVEVITSNPNLEGTLYSEELFKELQQTETYIDQIGVCKKQKSKIESNQVLVLDDIQNPDNFGALIRSAAAFGFLHIIISLQSADLYNEKTIRASKGAIFYVNVERKPLDEAIIELKNQGYVIVCSDAHGDKKLIKYHQIALILGNEGHGVSESIKNLADAFVTIETNLIESLNVSVAGGILMHEWRKL
jgi:RNA methyltransferase, TrmH family